MGKKSKKFKKRMKEAWVDSEMPLPHGTERDVSRETPSLGSGVFERAVLGNTGPTATTNPATPVDVGTGDQVAVERREADAPRVDEAFHAPSEAADRPATRAGAMPQSPQPTPDDVSRETSRPSVDPLPRPTHTRVIVVANQKGGVGKTTTVANVAATLAMGGLRVLAVDLDPQGNLSTALGAAHQRGVSGTYEVLLEGHAIADHAVVSTESDNLRVLPATIDLAGSEIQLVSMVARETRLKKALAAYLADNPTDYVFIDCPPSLGLLTLNALVAGSEILVPIQCEYYALEGLTQLLETIAMVKGELNDALHLSTVVLTMYDARTKLSQEVANEVRTAFPDETLRTAVPRSVRVAEAPSYGQTVVTYNSTSPGAQAYIKIASDIAARGAEN